MKKYLILSLFCLPLLCRGQYHIRVQCWGGATDPEYQDYEVVFTPDNWKTSFELMEAFDISDEDYPFEVCLNPKIFICGDTAKQEAIGFAREFTSLYKCLTWNKNQKTFYNQLIVYRKSHPIKKKPAPVHKKACCILTQIY